MISDENCILEKAPQEVVNYIKNLNLTKITGDIRHWGGYIHLDITPSSDKKILWITPTKDKNNPVKPLSLQFHGIDGIPAHREKLTVLTDMAYITGINNMQLISADTDTEKVKKEIQNNLKYRLLKKGDIQETKAGIIHAYVNPFYDKLVMLEEERFSVCNQTAEERETNIFRIYDQNGRGKLGEYPKEILERVKDLIK
jgi:hypothetical protein